jgi:hypothetical protein
MDDKKSLKYSLWLTETIIIAMVTALAYFSSILYEVGYFRYFSIPYYFISLNPTIVFSTNTYLFIIFGTSIIYILICEIIITFHENLLNIARVIFFSIIFILTVFSNQLGNGYAHKQILFPVIKQSPELVVLRSNGEYLYTVPFIRATKEFIKELVIVKMPEKTLTLTLENVGPLKAKQ